MTIPEMPQTSALCLNCPEPLELYPEPKGWIHEFSGSDNRKNCFGRNDAEMGPHDPTATPLLL